LIYTALNIEEKDMIKLAVNLSMIFTEVPLIERFALARAQGFNHVEIQFPYELTIGQIQNQLSTHQLNLCLINVPAGDLMQGGHGLAGIPGQEIEFRHAVEQAIQYATALNVPRVNILAGKQPLDCDLLPCLNTLASNLKMACSMLLEHQIEPVFEMINGTDMPRFLIQNIAQAQEMLEAHKARTIMVIKRSMATGYAGLDNDLFYNDKTMMIFGDAKKVVEDMTKAINGTGH
jgi:hydroxypyruvate isomerase